MMIHLLCTSVFPLLHSWCPPVGDQWTPPGHHQCTGADHTDPGLGGHWQLLTPQHPCNRTCTAPPLGWSNLDTSHGETLIILVINTHLEHHWWSCGPREEHSEVCPPDTWVFSWWFCCPGYSHCSVTTWSAHARPCSCSWCRHLCHSQPRHHETCPECGQSHEPGCRQHWSLEYSLDHKFCVTHDTCGRVQCSYGSDCTKLHHSTAVQRVTHATSPGNTQSVIIPDSILLCPHVQTRDQDTWDTVTIILYCHMIATYVPVSGVGLVILWVQIIAVVTERS